MNIYFSVEFFFSILAWDLTAGLSLNKCVIFPLYHSIDPD